MDLVDDIDLILADCRQKGGLVAQVTDIIHAVVGSRVDFRHIKDGAVINTAADLTFSAGVRTGMIQAVDGLGKNLCTGRFAGAARAGKQIRMSDTARGDLILQRRNNGILPNDIRKFLRTPFAVQGMIHLHAPPLLHGKK